MLLLFALGISSGCATYSDRMRDTQRDVVRGKADSALARVNKQLEVDHAYQLPKDLGGDNTLLLLERGTLLQGLGDFQNSARDLMVSDQRLDWLDMDPALLAAIGKYVYSDDAGPYKAPAYERIMVNIINMVNFMELRDFQGAKVEARRFQIMESYFLDEGGEVLLPEMLALGNYLAGVVFESSRDYTMATRYYSRAWHFGIRSLPFKKRLLALQRVSGYRGQEIDLRKSGLDALRDEALAKGPLTGNEYRSEFVEGEVVTVVQSGFVPYKRPERIPIGMAVAWATRYPVYFSASSSARANELMVSGALKWVNFPMLTRQGLPSERRPVLKINGEYHGPKVSSDIAEQVRVGWNEIAGPLMAAAISRMIVRAVLGAVSREATQAASQSGGGGTAQALGILAQLVVEGSMTAADTPDTRSWTTMPGKIQIFRTKAGVGTHKLEVNVAGRRETRTVKTGARALTVVNFSKYR